MDELENDRRADTMRVDRRGFLSGATLAGAGAALSALENDTARGDSPAQHPGTARTADDAPTQAPAPQLFGAADPHVPRIGLRWAFSATVFFADRITIGVPIYRGYTSVDGGEIWGPRLTGRVLPHSGADYYKWTFNTYYMFQASDGALIFIHNRGTVRRVAAPADTTPPPSARFRATPVFTAPAGPHDWMNRTVFVAHAQRRDNPDHTVFTYYEVL
jgi:hypothetical protein